MSSFTITRETPLGPDLTLLMERHTADMHADSPPESIHMLDAASLDRPGIVFYVLRDAGEVIGMGALKRLGDDHAEIKSMHILSERRGQGHSVRLLNHLLEEARREGYARLSLETGSQPSFAPARNLYARAGFDECEPFGTYRPDPNSTFMTLAL